MGIIKVKKKKTIIYEPILIPPVDECIEELERQDFKTDMICVMVSIPLIVLGTVCITLSTALQQALIGLVGVLLWAAILVVYIRWVRIKGDIYLQILQIEEELLEQMINKDGKQ